MSVNREDDEILQIMPADSWFAKFCNKNEPDGYLALVGWALVKNSDGTEMVGLDGENDAYVNFVDRIESFSEYIHEKNIPTEDRMMRRWRDISTAPTNGSKVIVWANGYGMKIMSWSSGGWDDGDFESQSIWPTHWQPLPRAPKIE